MTTNRIDHDQPEANMYGVVPCPKCSGRYRWPTRPVHPKHPNCIICDDCGFIEPQAAQDGERSATP